MQTGKELCSEKLVDTLAVKVGRPPNTMGVDRLPKDWEVKEVLPEVSSNMGVLAEPPKNEDVVVMVPPKSVVVVEVDSEKYRS